MDAALYRVLGCGGKWYRGRRFEVVALAWQAIAVAVVYSVNAEAVRTPSQRFPTVLDECLGLNTSSDSRENG
jgi:hypothetical protein